MGVVTEQIAQTIAFNGNTVAPVTVTVDVKRKLTNSEVKLAQAVYKNSIPYEKVWIIRGGLLDMPNTSKNAMTPFGSIYLPNDDYDETPDFSVEIDSDKIRWFIHEMAHVWQYYAMKLSVASRGAILGAKGGYSYANNEGKTKAYVYDLFGSDAGKEFKNFNIEQQADIIAHHFWVKNYPQTAKKYLSASLFSQQALRTLVLKDFLINPKNEKLRSINWGGYYRPRGTKR